MKTSLLEMSAFSLFVITLLILFHYMSIECAQ